MPDPRPISTLRNGAYDEPPATSESVSGRRSRIRRMLQHHLDSETNGEASIPQATSSDNGSRLMTRPSLRRRRSVSPLELEAEATPPEDSGGRRRRNKRRRLERSPSAQKIRPPMKYGYFGQVEPGRLKMELISCDGGEHKDPRSPENLGPQNMLRHDKSVYCSEQNCVNVVLRHADDTPFCLEKLHIVAPEDGFTSPVREGLVYVAMSIHELQEHINITPPQERPSPRRVPHPSRLSENTRPTAPPSRIARGRNMRASPERLTLADALRDPEIGAALTERTSHPATRAQNNTNPEEDLYAEDFGVCEPPYSRSSSADRGGFFGFEIENDVTRLQRRPFTLLSDEEPGPEDSSPPGWTEYRLQRWRNMRRRLEMENWDREDRWGGLNRLPPEPPAGASVEDRERAMINLSRLDALMARSRVRDDDEELPPPQAPLSPPGGFPMYYRLGRDPSFVAESLRGAKQASFDGESGSNVTRAHFYIKKSKHKVAIKFSPPVSGRFVLLKLWAGGNGKGGASGNVDVQSLILKGFGGGRFFPAVEMR